MLSVVFLLFLVVSVCGGIVAVVVGVGCVSVYVLVGGVCGACICI